jgi:putative methionine-R-sulfoxide reductase with GAF domain
MRDVKISESFRIADRRPRRPLFSFVLRHYVTIQTVGLVIILLLNTFRHAPVWTLTWIALYLVYRGIVSYSGWRPVRFVTSSNEGQLLIAFVLLAGVFVYLLYIYSNTNYLADVRNLDPLWLLFLLPVFNMSQHSRSLYFSISLVLAAVGVITIDIISSSWLTLTDLSVRWNIGFAILAKVISLASIAFAHYVFVRHIMDQHRDLKVIYEVSKEVMSVQEEQRILDDVVDMIATRLHYPWVHIFRVEPDESLRCVAGAGEGGRKRVERGFRVPPGVGIVGHVSQTGKFYAANDVSKTEGIYIRDADSDPGSPEPRAEVAVPIKGWGGQTSAVLDVQVYNKGHFVPFDVEVLAMLADYVGWIQSSRHEILYSQRVAHNLLSPEDWNLALRATLDDALKELGAHSIVLFENDPVSNSQRGVAYAGRLDPSGLRQIDWTIVNPDGLVSKLMKERGQFYDTDVTKTISKDPLFAPSPDHVRLKLPTFAQRHELRSRAIFVLRPKKECIGVLFVNYGNYRNFSAEERERLNLLAASIEAALYKDQIQRAQRAAAQADIERERRVMREELVNDVHDALRGTTAGLNQVLRHLISQVTLQQSQKDEDPRLQAHILEGLRNAMMAADLLLADIIFLARTNSTAFVGDFRDVIIDILTITRGCYASEPKPISIVDEWHGDPERVPTGVTLASKAIVSEVLFNAIRRVKADHVSLAFAIDEAALEITIIYDGDSLENSADGDDVQDFTSVNKRVQRMGGHLETKRTEEGGTRLYLHVPLLPRYMWASPAGKKNA